MNSIEKVLISSFPMSVFLVPFRGWDAGVIIYHSSGMCRVTFRKLLVGITNICSADKRHCGGVCSDFVVFDPST